MAKSCQDFYVMEYLPDDAGSPHFMDKNWSPELPDYDIFTSPPEEHSFSENYRLKASTEELDCDFSFIDNLASSVFIELCNKYGVSYLCRNLNISLLKRKKPEKEYFLFYLTDYIEILDKEKSKYIISQDIYTGLPDTTDSRGLSKTYYDEISNFVIKKDLKKDLFFCQELSRPVCSLKFKEDFESRNLKGIEFINIDDNFKYNAWQGW